MKPERIYRNKLVVALLIGVVVLTVVVLWLNISLASN